MFTKFERSDSGAKLAALRQGQMYRQRICIRRRFIGAGFPILLFIRKDLKRIAMDLPSVLD
jgi:hypothetical protein